MLPLNKERGYKMSSEETYVCRDCKAPVLLYRWFIPWICPQCGGSRTEDVTEEEEEEVEDDL